MPANVEPSPLPSAGKSDRVTSALRGLGPVGIVFILVVLVSGPLIGAALVLLWAWFTKTPWGELGFVRPKSWALTIAGGIAVGVAFKLLMKAVVMPLLGAPDTNPAYQYLVHNGGALPGTLLKVIVTAGAGEEIVWRGFLFERLGHLIGMTRKARIGAVIITATLFGLAHYPSQHWMGVQQAFIMGLLVGAYFAATRRIWPLIVMHAAFDVIAVLIIYWDLETRIANFVFG